MKRFGFVLLVAAAACGSAITAKETEIKTPTLQCGYCEKTVTDAVKKVDGVSSVKVDTEKGIVRVSYAEGDTDVPTIEKAIVQAGYQANDTKADSAAYQRLPDCCKVESGAH